MGRSPAATLKARTHPVPRRMDCESESWLRRVRHRLGSQALLLRARPVVASRARTQNPIPRPHALPCAAQRRHLVPNQRARSPRLRRHQRLDPRHSPHRRSPGRVSQKRSPDPRRSTRHPIRHSPASGHRAHSLLVRRARPPGPNRQRHNHAPGFRQRVFSKMAKAAHRSRRKVWKEKPLTPAMLATYQNRTYMLEALAARLATQSLAPQPRPPKPR